MNGNPDVLFDTPNRISRRARLHDQTWNGDFLYNFFFYSGDTGLVSLQPPHVRHNHVMVANLPFAKSLYVSPPCGASGELRSGRRKLTEILYFPCPNRLTCLLHDPVRTTPRGMGHHSAYAISADWGWACQPRRRGSQPCRCSDLRRKTPSGATKLLLASLAFASAIPSLSPKLCWEC